MSALTYHTRSGDWRELGAKLVEGGVNFCLFSRHATRIQLLLYERADSPEPFQVIPLDARENRTFFFWHLMVEGLPPGVWYAWRADGPGDTSATGCRFDPEKVLLDPWARQVSDALWDRERALQPGDNGPFAMRACVVDDGYDWEGDQSLPPSLEDAIIYEMHVGGFTRHASARVRQPGSFSAVVEKIPYLRELGITHVELMPVMAFDPQDVPPQTAELGLENYWGYSTHSFFAPYPGYCVVGEDPRRAFRDMVKALHRAGIGVILDVVLNHTAEGGADGPMISFKGIANEVFYHLDFADRSRYRDYTGCGNTVNSNHPLVTRFLLESLEYWVHEMHVDGFRFDLASALARGEDGSPHDHAPVLWGIELSKVLSHTPIIAEAWDAAGLYQVGNFPGFRWREWNGRYRDSLRRFVRGDPGLAGELATRLAGSSDLYGDDGRLPGNSINFVNCHDGFTLYDLVSYNDKHNEANGENNRDGHNDNLSWNCGIEGHTDDPRILDLRQRQAKNLVAILLLSQGVPMLLAGDEVLRTQHGNNNCYCQNNELAWFDWRLVEKNRAMFEFVSGMIDFRKRHACLRHNRYLTGEKRQGQRLPDITWHGLHLNDPPWDDPGAQVLAYTLAGTTEAEADLHIMLNMGVESRRFELPVLDGRCWVKVVDTAAQPGAPENPGRDAAPEADLLVEGRSVVVMESRPSVGNPD